MTAKEYLSQYRDCMVRIKEISRHLQELRGITESLRGEDDSPRVALAVSELDDAQDEVTAEIDRLIKLRDDVVSTINSVSSGTYRSLLYNRYVLGMTWEQVAVDMGYSYVHIVHRLHPLALADLQKKLKCN